MTEAELLAWRESESGQRWSSISRALHWGEHDWAFRLLIEEGCTPSEAEAILPELIATQP